MRNNIELAVDHSLRKSKHEAINGGVLICIDAEKYDFQFVDLENVPYKNGTLQEYIDNLEEENINLKDRVAKCEKAILELADAIDKNRFL